MHGDTPLLIIVPLFETNQGESDDDSDCGSPSITLAHHTRNLYITSHSLGGFTVKTSRDAPPQIPTHTTHEYQHRPRFRRYLRRNVFPGRQHHIPLVLHHPDLKDRGGEVPRPTGVQARGSSVVYERTPHNLQGSQRLVVVVKLGEFSSYHVVLSSGRSCHVVLFTRRATQHDRNDHTPVRRGPPSSPHRPRPCNCAGDLQV